MISTLLSTDGLLKLIRSKARNGAEALYDQYAVVLRLVIFRIVQDKELTDIVLEKTICKIWDTAAQYNEHKLPLLAWMLTIAKSLANEYKATPVTITKPITVSLLLDTILESTPLIKTKIRL